MSVQAVIDIARSDLGYTEFPANSNMTKFGEWYGMNGQPWCVMALAFWFDKAGERMAFFGGGKTASCSTLLRWYKEQGLTVSKPFTKDGKVNDVQPGDIVILNFNGKGTADHCGLVEEIQRDALGYGVGLITIEGNTSGNGSQSNGDSVYRKVREARQVVAVCRPQYKEEDAVLPQPPAGGTGTPSSGPTDHLPTGEGKDDITGHWAEEDIRWCMEHGLMNGYPDGSFQPDKPATRAEIATILRRVYDNK